jgi:hypothetical protein
MEFNMQKLEIVIIAQSLKSKDGDEINAMLDDLEEALITEGGFDFVEIQWTQDSD